MLSIDNLEDAEDAGDYYLGKNKGSYYAKGGEGENWYGKGASKLGLEGRVDKEVFVKLLEGKRKNHASGVDMTFNAPKSVSIMAEVFGDNITAALFMEHTSRNLDPRVKQVHRH